jgi:hypothetical protein
MAGFVGNRVILDGLFIDSDCGPVATERGDKLV